MVIIKPIIHAKQNQMLKYLQNRSYYIFFVLIFSVVASGISQDHYFKLIIDERSELEQLTDIISIDNYRDSIVTAYASEQEYQNLLKLGYAPIPINSLKSLTRLKMMSETVDTVDWNAYPTHAQYMALMQNFAEQHPQICRLDTFGYSALGKPLLVVKISDNVVTDEAEPEFFYSAQMHGDEILTYMVLLRLIDYMLHNYQSDARIKKLIDNTEVWINPLFNPDGTYRGQDTTVAGATRYNANGVDLNRNFPDPNGNNHPDGNEYQPETLALMNFASNRHFVMSANLHTGSELLNYPWDTWAMRSADDRWWKNVCRRYVDTVRVYAPTNYMRARNDGITNGYDWYPIHGGRQDYMNYFQHCREVTMELCYTKALADSALSDYWEYNKKALISFMEETHKGLCGVVRDKAGNSVQAKISIPGYDHDHSEVYSDSLYGIFYKLLPTGNYSIEAEARGFSVEDINNIEINDSAAVYLNIVLNRPPQITSWFPRRLDSVMLDKGYIFNASIADKDGDSLNYGFIYGDSVIYDTTAALSFEAIGRDSVIFYVEDGSDTTFHKWLFIVPRLMGLESEKLSVERFNLRQNYPNPFNPLTEIAYNIPVNKGNTIYRVNLEVYNSLGQKVYKISQRRRAGAYSFIFNGRKMSSGVYFYKISISEENGKTVYFSRVKKMIILK